MSKYFEIVEKYNCTREQLLELDKEYVDKIKGDVYRKRKAQLILKMDDLKRMAERIGTNGIICHVQGKRQRPHRKNPKLMIQERFNLYFVDVTDQEVSALVKLHVPNVVHYNIIFIRPGVLIITS